MSNAPPQSAAAASVAAHYLATMATDREPSSPSLSGLSCFFQDDDGDGDDAGGASDGASSGTQGGLQEVSVNDGGINEDVPDVSIAELESMSRNDRYEQIRAECYLHALMCTTGRLPTIEQIERWRRTEVYGEILRPILLWLRLHRGTGELEFLQAQMALGRTVWPPSPFDDGRHLRLWRAVRYDDNGVICGLHILTGSGGPRARIFHACHSAERGQAGEAP